jgi:hypothetical protein
MGSPKRKAMSADDVGEMFADLVAIALAHPHISMEQVVLRSPSDITSNGAPAATPILPHD